MLQQASRTMRSLIVRPWLSLLDKTVADEEVFHRHVEHPAYGKIASQRNPQRQRSAKAQRAIEKSVPIRMARYSASSLPNTRCTCRIIVGQCDLQLIPINLMPGIDDGESAANAARPILNEDVERRKTRFESLFNNAKCVGVSNEPRHAHFFGPQGFVGTAMPAAADRRI